MDSHIRTSPSRPALLLAIVVAIAAAASYFHRVPADPPGFHADEASIAFNAMTIAATGHDEHGVRFPLLFEAFGEYKNPTFIYLLSAVFKVFGPSRLAARALSATLGVLAAATIGLVGWRITRSRLSGLTAFVLAAATPAVFEISRAAFEACMYPFVIALFALAACVASTKERWGGWVIGSLAGTLFLVTYTYSIGRLLGVLLLAGLAILSRRENRRRYGAVALIYAATAVAPLLVIEREGGGATKRFWDVSYLSTTLDLSELVVRFEEKFVLNARPFALALTGDSDQLFHVQNAGAGMVLLGELGLVAVSVALIVRERASLRWWGFVGYCCLASLVPVSLTNDVQHTLRMSAFPVFFLILTIPAIGVLFRPEGVSARERLLIACFVMIGAIQAFAFRVAYEKLSPARGIYFDVPAIHVVEAALSRGSDRIYVRDPRVLGLDAHVHWIGALQGRSVRVVKLKRGESPPDGAIVVANGGTCEGCAVFAHDGLNYAYAASAATPNSEDYSSR